MHNGLIRLLHLGPSQHGQRTSSTGNWATGYDRDTWPAPEEVQLAPDEKLRTEPNRVFVHRSAVLLGDVAVGDMTSIWPCATVRADNGGRVRIGRESNIQEHAGIHSGEAAYPVSIGNRSTLAHGAIVHGASIGDFVCIGMGAVVLNGASIPDFVLVGANAVVPEGAQLESGMLYVGAPVKPIRALSASQRTWLVDNAEKYVGLARQALGLPAPADSAAGRSA